MPGSLAELDNVIAELLAPLRKQAEAIDKELEELETRKSELRAARSKINRLMSANNAMPTGRRTNAKKSKRSTPASERVDELAAYLRAHFKEKEFTSLDFRDRGDFKARGMSHSYVASALNQLHERHIIRLVRVGSGLPGPGAAKTKVWRLTDARS